MSVSKFGLNHLESVKVRAQAHFRYSRRPTALHIHFDVARAERHGGHLDVFGLKKNDNTFKKLVVDSSA
jgi:hypothetical protein